MIDIVALACCSIVIAALAELCASVRIQRNPIVGIRLPSLFASNRAWQTGHRAAILLLAITAAAEITLATSALLAPGWAGVGTGVALLVLAVGLDVARIFANRAAQTKGHHSGKE